MAFPEMVLTGYPVEDLALRGSFVEASPGRAARARRRLDEEGFGELPVVVGYLDRVGARAAPLGQPGRCPAERRGRAARRRGGADLRQAPPAQLRRLRRVPLLRARRHAARRPGPRRRRRPRHLRGPVAGRRPGARAPAPRGAGLLLSVNASPYERDKDDTRLELVPQAGPGGRLHHRVPRDDRRPGRAGLRRRLDRRRRRTAKWSRAHRSSPRAASCWTWSCPRPRPTPPPGSSTTGCASTTSSLSAEPLPAYEPELTGGVRASASTTTRRSTRRWSSACARTPPRTASARC